MALGVADRFAFERYASSLCKNAVPATVRKVEQKTERHLNDEPFPGDGRELRMMPEQEARAILCLEVGRRRYRVFSWSSSTVTAEGR
jgi:hypothetical protein